MIEARSGRPLYKIAVVGANGGIGYQVVLQALAAGYQVAAILRSPEKLPLQHPHLTIRKGDVMGHVPLDLILMENDIVVSAIGKSSVRKTVLYSQGNQNLADAMKRDGINRAFFISASGLEVNPTHSLWVRLATRYLLQPILKNWYTDVLRMEKLLKESAIDWTIMRLPKLLNDAVTGKYRTAVNGQVDQGVKISRADVAHYIIAHLNDGSIVKTTVEIAY